MIIDLFSPEDVTFPEKCHYFLLEKCPFERRGRISFDSVTNKRQIEIYDFK